MAAADSPLAALARPRTWRGIRSSDDWRTSALVLLAVLVTMPGLHTILIGTAWVVQLGLVCVLVIGAAAGTRLLTRFRALPPIVAVVAFIAALTAVFEPDTAFLAVIPTNDTLAGFAALLQQATTSINQQSLPAHSDAGITFVMCLGIAAIALAADIAALVLRAPALVGIPLLVLLAVPPYISPGSTDPVTFVLAAIAYLLLLRIGSRRGQGTFSLGFGASILVLSLVVSFALPATVAQSSNAENRAFGTGVNPVLSLGNDLRQSANRSVLTYRTTSGDAHYLRLVSIVDFTGSNWAPDSFAIDRKNSVDRIAAAPGLSPSVKAVRDSTTVSVGSLTSRWLPLPYPTGKVSGLTGNWFWDTDGHAVSSGDRTSDGQRYTASDLEIVPTADQLVAGGNTVPAGLSRFLVVPKGMPAVVAATARTVVGSAATNYEKALLLQAYFHDGDFVYSETSPVSNGYDGTGGQVIAKFLATKSGYCIHFASAMAVMARTLGIPARISVGFLPGHVVGGSGSSTQYEVDSHDLHAWPELYFAGVGWTRFEPTVSKGDVPAYATGSDPTTPTPLTSDGSAPGSTTTGAAVPVTPARAAPRAGSATDSSSAPAANAGSWLLLALAIVLIFIASVVPAVVRIIQRRRRLLGDSVAGRWRELLQVSTDIGRPISDTLTPRDAAVRLAGEIPAGSKPALDRILASLEHERFARLPLARPLLAQEVAADDARAVISALYSSVGARNRLRARFYPPSLWRRILRR